MKRAILALALIASPAMAQETFGAWKIHSRVDPMTDKPGYLLLAEGAKMKIGFFCGAPGKSMFVSIDGRPYLGTADRRNTRTVQLRVDDQPSVESTAWIYLDRSVTPSSNKDFARMIADGATLKVKVVDYNLASHYDEIPIGGAREAIERVYSLCAAKSPFTR
ncbi:MAG: hypothetical protein RL268_296 [Pseudomonadota bacterium]|jgi:hypothetical protein